MDIPSLSDGPVGSRFVSQDEIDSAKQRKEEQWKAAYARLGQEPPPQQHDDAYDGRSLAEKLAANRIAKQEEWEEKNKLANQFRALEEDEIQFLDSIRQRQEAEERQRKQEDGEELKQFKQAVAARENSLNNPPPIPGSSQASKPKPPAQPPRPAPKKDVKKSLKGVVVKKKSKPVPAPSSNQSKPTRDDPTEDTDSRPVAKRRKVSEVSS
ncbi:hypothetical protein P691DRAFT_803781 [Macrolepiota fuliginosa MF-IS2]|uniref:FAM192A/Fyv6 N-terminal domain-containing protein n=1 Tax=Macrolepiota fuliginosa MF-IS2 TaxID=1400762 RepID=A0A9P6C5N2_9AGAR|nr:hypothetical protein P691DRAFT_803781 [Macrolepiota fuliginosa MF-IS2]